MSVHRLRVVPLLVAATMCLIVNACSSSSSSTTGYLDNSGAEAQYQEEAGRLELPPSFAFPEHCPKLDASGNTVYGPGFGKGEADWYWIYCWEVEWLEQRGTNLEREAKALNVLKNEAPLCWGMNEGCDDGTREFFAACVGQAEMGDPSGFQRDVDLNCPQLIRIE